MQVIYANLEFILIEAMGLEGFPPQLNPGKDTLLFHFKIRILFFV